MVAGPNGSGKSTLTDALRADPAVQLPALYINADDLQRAQRFDTATAQLAAANMRERAIAERRDLMYETVMSHPSKLAELQHARATGYTVVVHFVAIEDPAINAQRVAIRVAGGGHDVPPDKIRERHGRTLALAPAALGHADQALIFDNTRRGAGGLDLQATLQDGRLELLTAAPARWVGTLARRVDERAIEFEALQAFARSRGHPLMQAPLSTAVSRGTIVDRGGAAHRESFYLQHDPRSNALVVHDKALLQHELDAGKAYAITYKAGVGKAQAMDRSMEGQPRDSTGGTR